MQFHRGPKKDKDAWRKAGGFAPIKKLKLTTEEPEVEIPPFFPKVGDKLKCALVENSTVRHTLKFEVLQKAIFG